ncbi:hypothetical protein [Chondromyces apiculatus]|uniref:hypothetical protein n=1 Tax=Chondromyces apiculatus TaxID=51 RepID=UPI0005C4AA82|nr:hypothetical protein [Chondromyces apiculatus]
MARSAAGARAGGASRGASPATGTGGIPIIVRFAAPARRGFAPLSGSPGGSMSDAAIPIIVRALGVAPEG